MLCIKNTAYTIAFLLVFIFVNHSMLAQEIESEVTSEEDHYGLKAGINFAELYGSDALPESDRKEGYSFGVYASYKLAKDFKIQPEVIWSLQGEKSKSSGRYKISYVNVPIMLKWKSGHWYYELGPQLGFLTINTSSAIPDSLRLENFEILDFAINVGIGYNLFEDWNLGVRYIHGVTNIVETKDLKNSVIYLGLSYRIF